MKKNIIFGVTLFLSISFWLFFETIKENRNWEDDIMNQVSHDTISPSSKRSVTLNSGYDMPIIGLGTWTQNNEEAEMSVYHALKVGYRLIDTAQYYGNEIGVGNGIKRAIDDKIVKREEIFVTTKVSPNNFYSADESIDESLKKLNLDYVDLFLIHQHGSNDKEVYKAMERAVEQGKVRSIGISNYYTKKEIDEVLSYANIVPAVIQNENHFYYQNTELQKYVKKYGIMIESWYPFGGRGHTKEHFNHRTIIALSSKYNKTPAQIILRWQIQAGYIAIPGSSNKDHIQENYDIFDFELTKSDMEEIQKLDTGNSLFFNHQDPNMVEWFDKMVVERRTNKDCHNEKKGWETNE